jgi:hypothetical protein
MEGGGEHVGPAPVAVDLEPEFAAATDQSSGDVQQPVAQHLGFGLGEVGLVCQKDGLGPGDEVDGGQRAGRLGTELLEARVARGNSGGAPRGSIRERLRLPV